MRDSRPWTPDQPFLYVLTLEARHRDTVADAVRERFGMRSMAVEGKQLVVNHEPLFWRTSSPEFAYSPTISPLVDKSIIRRRIRAMKDMGFNGNRLHTHVYTRQALDVCDEMGFLLQVEPSVISNANEIRPYPASRASLTAKVREIRNHPSVVVICLGNENSQIIERDAYRERAKVHLADIRDLVPDHLILTGCGYQGEYPDVYNDFQTPHFWADYYKWAHDGLTALPWAGVQHLSEDGPVVIHEYGKFTVWPNPAEDRLFRDADMPLCGNYGEMGRVALREAGIEACLPDIVENSRRLSAACTKIALEQVRRRPGVQGYQYHCSMRVGRNRGFIDDLGCHTDPQFANLPLANGDTALMIDLDFRRRSLTNDEPVELGVYLSHFGPADVARATLHWSIEADGTRLDGGRAGDLHFARGANGLLARLDFITPEGLGKFTMCLTLVDGDGEIARNRWEFWRFPQPRRTCAETVATLVADTRWEDDLLAHYPTLRRLDDILIAHLGVMAKQWCAKDGRFAPPPPAYARLARDARIRTVIADRWTESLAAFAGDGGTVLLLDRGLFPPDWYVPAPERDGRHHLYRMYAPFRSGWDHGNAATIVEPHLMLGDFPHDGWCDLHCFDMIQGAASLVTARLPGPPEVAIRVVPIWRTTGDQVGPVSKSQDVERRWATEDRCYLAAAQVGKGRVVICSLRLLNNPAGSYLFQRLLRYASASLSTDNPGGGA